MGLYSLEGLAGEDSELVQIRNDGSGGRGKAEREREIRSMSLQWYHDIEGAGSPHGKGCREQTEMYVSYTHSTLILVMLMQALGKRRHPIHLIRRQCQQNSHHQLPASPKKQCTQH